MSKTTFEVKKDKSQIYLERVFDAPCELVWRAHTENELLKQWWSPEGYEAVVEEFDLREGGKWKMINQKGEERHVFYGEFREIKKPEKLTWTFTYEPVPESINIETLTLEDLGDNKTKLSALSQYPSPEALESALASGGMEKGVDETWNRLEKVLAGLK